jgi:hypothetical protein
MLEKRLGAELDGQVCGGEHGEACVGMCLEVGWRPIAAAQSIAGGAKGVFSRILARFLAGPATGFRG